MAIYCNTLEGNMQYGDDPYCFTPISYQLLYRKKRIIINFYAFPLMPHIKAFNTLHDYWLLHHFLRSAFGNTIAVRHSLSLLFITNSW